MVSLLSRPSLTQGMRLCDGATIVLAFAVALLVTSQQLDSASLVEFLRLRIELHNFALFGLMVCIWIWVLTQLGAYDSARLTDMHSESRRLVLVAGAATVAVGIVAVLFRVEIVTPSFAFVFWVAASLLLVGSRIAAKVLLLTLRNSGKAVRHALIVGTNPRAVALAHRIETDRKTGFKIVGFVDDHWTGTPEFGRTGYSVVSNIAGFLDFIRRNPVDDVFIFSPMKSQYEQSAEILAFCEEQGITARFEHTIFTPTSGKVVVETRDDQAWISVVRGPIPGMRNFFLKRMLDLLIASISLLILAVPMLLIALAIKLDSPGPALFVQKRLGQGKRVFALYKFRTMHIDAEAKQNELLAENEMDGPVFKIRNDPRITRLGRLLRRLSLDELPQLINVLIGDMATVGPRPLPLRDCEGLSLDAHRRRFSVRPGITCLWQVMGRNSLPFDEWMALDMHYIDNWSLWLDIKILVRTIPAVLTSDGAY